MDPRWLRILLWRLKRLFHTPILPPQPPRLDASQLAEAQQIQRQTGSKDITEILISLNMVGEREIQMAKAQELGYGFVDIERVRIDSDALSALEPAQAKRLETLPVKREGKTLWICFASPPDHQVCEELSQLTGCRIVPILAVREHLISTIERNY